jgi:hypothetical protein
VAEAAGFEPGAVPWTNNAQKPCLQREGYVSVIPDSGKAVDCAVCDLVESPAGLLSRPGIPGPYDGSHGPW